MVPDRRRNPEHHRRGRALSHILTLLLLLLAAGTHAASGEELFKWYSEHRRAYFDHPDQRIELLPKLQYPYVKVRDAEAESAFFQSEKCRENPADCIYEWVLPLSTIRGSEEVAADLLYQWRRFEERYFWYTITYLNNPVYWFFWCVLDLGGIVNGATGGNLFIKPNPDEDAVKYRANPFDPAKSRQGIPREVLPPSLEQSKIAGDVLKYAPHASTAKMRLDYYFPIPRIENSQFCDAENAGFKLPVLYIPGFCIYLNDQEIWCTPGYDEGKPLWIDEGEAYRRIQAGLEHALRDYYPEYQLEALKAAMLPRASLGSASVYAPLPWTSPALGSGAAIAAVADPATDLLTPAGWSRTLQDVQKIAQIVREVFARGNLSLSERIAVIPYYTQGLLILLEEAKKTPGAGAAVTALENLANSLLDLPRPLLNTAKSIAASQGIELDISLPADLRGKTRKLLEIAHSLNEIQVVLGQSEPLKVPGIPGYWKLEEVKRWFPASNQLVHEAFGYQTFFQVFQTIQASIIPDYSQFIGGGDPLQGFINFAAGLAFRPVLYWWIPFGIKIWLTPYPPFLSITVEVEPPKARWFAPYWLPFGAAQTAWDWVSVPEGYAMPRVLGTPGDLAAISKIVPGLKLPNYSDLYAKLLNLETPGGGSGGTSPPGGPGKGSSPPPGGITPPPPSTGPAPGGKP